MQSECSSQAGDPPVLPQARPAWSRCRRSVLIGLSLVLLPTVILAGAWRLGGVSALEDDLLYYLPIREYVGERIRAGELPLWNPFVGMGTNLAADPQSGLWYPPTWLFAVAPPLTAYPVTVMLHFALAGWGMYRFLRAARRDWTAAFLGAIAFEFCGFVIAHRAHLTMHEATAWIPWIFFGWQRFAATGRYRHFASAAVFLGLQMLVQHTQVSIMTVVLLTGYAAFVLLPLRRGLLWQYPVGIALGAAIAAVQIVPTAYHLFGSGRATPTYATFVENFWTPSSALMLLFPMIYGLRTPSIWGSWWGVSHFCEQSAYGSILILLLAGASAGLLRREGKWNREVLFWWAAIVLALLVAMGDLTPLSRLLFHVPIYRSLRVPARWILVWSFAMPVLASAVVTSLQRGGVAADRARAALRIMVARVLPVAVLLCLVVLIVARLLCGCLEAAYGDRWGAKAILDGVRSAVRPGNLAIWWELAIMLASCAVLRKWARQCIGDSREGIPVMGGAGKDFRTSMGDSRTSMREGIPAAGRAGLRHDEAASAAQAGRDSRPGVWPLLAIMLLDLASVAAFVDMDIRTYSKSDLLATPPLAQAIADLHPDPGHRLLVPRYQADYARPLEVLWPETNLRHGISTFNAYGPFWPRGNRLLFRFMAWGSNEGMLELLRNPRLCAAMGVRFIAARTEEERAIVDAMQAPSIPFVPQEIPGTDCLQPVRQGHDLLWPVRIDQPGIYRLRFQAEPVAGSASQWFIRLETSDVRCIGWARRLEPVDLSAGQRRMEFLFVCPQAMGPVFIRIKAEAGHALSVGWPEFGQAARLGAEPSTSPASGPQSPLDLIPRGVTRDGIHLYEIPSAVPLVRVAEGAVAVPDLAAAVEHTRYRLSETGENCYESDGDAGVKAVAGGAVGEGSEVQYDRPAPEWVRATVRSAGRRLLILNESWDSGWQATVNGLPARVLRVNAVVQGLVVPAGESRVEWRFRPRGLTAGGITSAGALLLLSAGFVVFGVARWRQPALMR